MMNHNSRPGPGNRQHPTGFVAEPRPTLSPVLARRVPEGGWGSLPGRARITGCVSVLAPAALSSRVTTPAVSAAVPAHQFGERVDLGGERGAASACDTHPGPRPAALVA